MATRRTAHSDNMMTEKNEKPAPGEKSDIAPAVPALVIPFLVTWISPLMMFRHVIYKLLGFTLAMVVGPIGSYFLTLNTIFGGNSTYAGATAAIMANVVLVGYVVVAFNEDQTEVAEAAKKEKKQL